MSGKFRRIIGRKKKALPPPGTSPGVFHVTEDALIPRITIYSFSQSTYGETNAAGFEELKEFLHEHSKENHWIDIQGLGDNNLLTSLKDHFSISALVMEDIVHTRQRPKLEEYEDYVFAISRMICLAKEGGIENEQVSFILTKNILFTFQENYDDCLDPVRKRLREGKGSSRAAGPSYLMYALMDLIIDNYFYILNKMGDELDSLEDRLYAKQDKSITVEAQQIKRALITIRRAAWPERDKVNDMIRSQSPLITKNTRFFLKDLYDHSIQVIDLVESYKELSTSLIDMYLSFVSNRTNEVMRLLTVISSVFIPLTFIAGVYGMNFAREDPETGKVLDKNMPELYSEHGYLYTILVMVIIALLQLFYFWRKGWLK
ncbi:magnesium/cobalt transporter CorA [Desertivirga brevis]|uniref:magnesium/cobalt transporter CorA n=1 Tax=Desertivirga brevis TaxID=2810310 RepID=UPI001A96BA2F|nr:magnesium/cobalt transporter CorA [Pedobacter sp. SYSU D00873]